MGLPATRDYTLDSSSKVYSSLLNKLQDCVITLDSQVATLEGSYTELEGTDTSLDGRVDALEAADVALDARLDALEGGGGGSRTYVYSASSIRVYSASGVSPTAHISPAEADNGSCLLLVGDNAKCSCPLQLEVGKTITAWSVLVYKQSNTGVVLHAELLDESGISGVTATAPGAALIGASQSNGTNSPSSITLLPISLGQSGLSTVVQAGHSYSITFWQTGGGYDIVHRYSVTVT